ncbi:DUF726-domain-containing protein [Westerdykella ornata]|uniref:DUF726-domain-containing protein n=1 Tax=Westerdykella ornata TaxID=318751 RepID=A0A6A6J6Y0_WESOR|nr:DUF726-domain-containing protein [Westerdykella ornata]KAF2271977.1 DUF726-domain-containing protein [Westerdykella ornata]
MENEAASGSPIEEKKKEEKEKERPRQEEVEYDDFGLPIRKPRPRSLEEESSGEGDEEQFVDTVDIRSGSRENVAVQEKATLVKEEAEKSEPLVNGRKEEGDEKEEEKGEQSGEHSGARSTQQIQPIEEPIPHKESPESEPHADTSELHKPPPESSSAHARQKASISEYSHQQLAISNDAEGKKKDDLDDEWQTMPAYAHWDMYDDDNRLIARENAEELEDMSGYGNVGGAAKGYTRVTMDDDVESVTSMDENTAYLFKEHKGTAVLEDDEDEAARDPLSQMQTTKNLLTEGQRIAYVGLVRLAMVEMENRVNQLERTKGSKKIIELTLETTKMWAQKMMVRLYAHMDIDASEQIMIEQLKEHGVVPSDLTPALMQNARVKNPVVEETTSSRASLSSPQPDKEKSESLAESSMSPSPPPYQDHEGDDLPKVRIPSQLEQTKNLDIDLRWTVLCDLFLVLIADSVYDARSRQLMENVGKSLGVDWLEICRFEKRVTDALEMQEEASKENWNEEEHMEDRRKRALKKRLAFMGLATVGGGLVIGLSAGLLAPVIGTGLALGFSTIGVAGTGTFLAGAGGAAIITTTGVLSGGTIAVRAANRRTGAVKTFEYRPLHNNKRVNLIVTVSGWMSGKVDDVRLPFSTVDPIMGDIYSVLWEPDMLRSMGDTINILATEALTQGLQQVLGSTLLVALMSAIQLPVILTKLSYLIDNPWTVSQARADMAGLILADSIIARNLGTRPITLVGFSLGARVIFACLKELAHRGAFGLVQNVYLFGTPVVAKKDEYTKLRAIVPGRFVNGYARNDWILGYLFRATSGGIMRVAGLAPVEVPGIENINVTELVPGHMAYRAAMPKLLREVGWTVESDEFTEIEDPDPDNHEQRQRELINEIEEARKELEQKPEKKGFSFWRKKKAAKKDWEVYDEHSQKPIDKDQDTAAIAENPVIFDLDAIRKEVAALSAEGIEVKEIQSTLPPMKIDMAAAQTNPHSTLRETKSYNDSIGQRSATLDADKSPFSHSNGAGGASSRRSYDEYDEYDEHTDGGVTMTFDTSFHDSPGRPIPRSSTSLESSSYKEAGMPTWDTPSERPPLKPAVTEPNLNLTPGYNAWADEYDDDEFGKEREMKMTFE